MLKQKVQVTLPPTTAGYIATSQAVGANDDLVLNENALTDVAGAIVVGGLANGNGLDIEGIDLYGNTITETIAGTASSGAVVSTKFFSEVTLANSGQILAAVEVAYYGGSALLTPKAPDTVRFPFEYTMATVFGDPADTATYKIQYTFEDPATTASPTWFDLTGTETTQIQERFTVVAPYYRVLMSASNGEEFTVYTVQGG